MSRTPGATFRRQRLGAGGAGNPRRESILAILEDRTGSLWIGTARGGLYRLEAVPALEAGEATAFATSEHYRHREDPGSLSHDEVRVQARRRPRAAGRGRLAARARATGRRNREAARPG